MPQKLIKKFELDPTKIPVHIAVIMDGNGRWAKAKNLPRIMGHKAGHSALNKLVTACQKLQVRYVSVYAFSTENWNRQESEVSFLLTFFKKLMVSEVPKLKKKNIRAHIIGDFSRFDSELQSSIEKINTAPQFNHDMQLNLLINYGGRDEIIHAVKAIVDKSKTQDIAINDTTISQHLYTKDIPDPDIMIRTSGEYRLSNFLLWQLAYTEFFFLPVLWPDFNEDHVGQVIKEFQMRNRRFGKES